LAISLIIEQGSNVLFDLGKAPASSTYTIDKTTIVINVALPCRSTCLVLIAALDGLHQQHIMTTCLDLTGRTVAH
jgi:hypothetical protein